MAAPWDSAASHEQLFVLITGANSGIGLGAAERIIDDFLNTRSLTSHLILIPTTRSIRKSLETAHHLKKHLTRTASESRSLGARAGTSFDPQTAIARVHVYNLELDLCDLPSIYAAARILLHGKIGDATVENGPRYRIPRLDSIILNAGISGFTGLHWFRMIKFFLTNGLIQMCTYPNFRAASPGVLVQQKPVKPDSPKHPPLGEIFCANVFGHYLLVHELLPLLARSSPKIPRGRIIWTSSLDAHNFRLDDFQFLREEVGYDSSKGLTDLLALTNQLPAAKPYTESFFTIDDPKIAAEKPIKPIVYVSHPGIVWSTIMPLWWPFMIVYKWSLYLSRWVGSPWHPVDGYRGATACVWLSLEDEETLEELDAHKIKWGSCTDFWGNAFVKKTEVEGWGWEGKVEDRVALAKDPAAGVLRKLKGRKPGAVDLTLEQREAFEETGAECWKEMERLRAEWEHILQVR